MATNTLTRTESSNELFIYRHTQASGIAEATVTSLIAPVTGYNNPFDDASGKWRILNLRIEAGAYDAILEFGFKNADTTKPLSAICGFTVGQPPFYATHINTISKSIAYGFMNNPFTDTDGLYIIHENILTQVSGAVDISALRIIVKDGVISYYSGNTLVLSSIMSISLCPLYVAGVLGYAGNQIIDIGINGANGYTLPIPDYTKELYFLCNGLKNLLPRYPGRLSSTSNPIQPLTYIAVRTSAAFVVSYPNKDVSVSASTGISYYVLPENYSAIPFVVKITFSSLSDVTGLQFVNGAIGAGISLFRSINSLTGLKELEVRGSTERRTLGQNTFPSSLESLYLHGNHDVTNPLSVTTFLKTLRYLEQPSNTTSTNFEFLGFPNLQLLEIPESAAWTSSNFESLQNFRLMFNPSRNVSTHGFYGSALSTGSSYLTVITNLAIAQQSAAILYNWEIQNSGNNTYISGLINYASQVSGFNFNPTREGGGDTISVSGSTITLIIQSTANITTETDGFLVAQQFILLKNGTSNSNKQLRRIASVAKSTSGNNITYTITTSRVKTDVSCSSVVVSSQSSSIFIATGTSITSNIANIRIGDTARINTVTLPLSNTTTPSIVISKTANSVTILKGTANDGIAATLNGTVVFDYEFTAANHPTAVTSPGTASETHFSSGTRAIYNYLI
jgi:hypothetical protein